MSTQVCTVRKMTTSTETQPSELVVVTGASTGIGKATAQRLAADGFLVLAGVRREQDATALRANNIEPIILDITDEQQVAALAKRIATDPLGRPLRAVINNAGIAINAPVETVRMTEWRRQFEVGVFGHVAVIQAVLPFLLKSGGRVINVSSVGGKVAMPSFGPYSGAKFAIEGITDALRREVEQFGVRVVSIIPGAVKTNLNERGVSTAHRMIEDMTPEQRTRYAPLMKAFEDQANTWSETGSTPEKAADVIAHAVQDRRPRTRYTVGRDAAMLSRISRIVTDRMLDRMVRRQMKL